MAHLNVYRDMGIEWGNKDCQHMLSVRDVLGVEVGLHAPLTSKISGGVWYTWTAAAALCLGKELPVPIEGERVLGGPQNLSRWFAKYTGRPRRNGQNFGRVFLMLNYTDITQNTYIQSWTVTEIMAFEKCGLLGCPRTVSRPWRHTHTLRMPGNEKPLANIGMQWPWRDNAQLRPA